MVPEHDKIVFRALEYLQGVENDLERCKADLYGPLGGFGAPMGQVDHSGRMFLA